MLPSIATRTEFHRCALPLTLARLLVSASCCPLARPMTDTFPCLLAYRRHNVPVLLTCTEVSMQVLKQMEPRHRVNPLCISFPSSHHGQDWTDGHRSREVTE
jgi:hypothetical protein